MTLKFERNEKLPQFITYQINYKNLKHSILDLYNHRAIKNTLKSSILNKMKKYFQQMGKQFLNSFVFYPDEHRFWKYSVNKNIISKLKSEKIDLIFSSSSPVSSHIVAKKIKKKLNVPWVADLRDLWSQNHYKEYNQSRLQLEKRLEVKTLSNADLLVTVSEPLKQLLMLNHPRKNILSITNGFSHFVSNTKNQKNSKFTITYTGQLYRTKRDPSILLKAVRELIQRDIIHEDKIEINFFGPQNDYLNELIYNSKLNKVVFQRGEISREEAIESQKKSHMLLLLNWDNPMEVGVYTGKLFEYLASRVPILAIGGKNNKVVEEVLQKTKAGTFISSYEELIQTLEMYYKEYFLHNVIVYNGIEDELMKYSHENMAKRFCEAFDNLLL